METVWRQPLTWRQNAYKGQGVIWERGQPAMSSIVRIGAKKGDRALAKNVKAIEAVKPKRQRAAYTIKDEKGLRLVVHPTGNKVWFSVYQLGKGEGLKRKWREIGPYSSHEEGWTLAKACEKNRGIQGELKFTGLDPSAPNLQRTVQRLAGWAREREAGNLAG